MQCLEEFQFTSSVEQRIVAGRYRNCQHVLDRMHVCIECAQREWYIQIHFCCFQCGVIECVPNAKSRDQLGRQAEVNLYEYFVSTYGGEEKKEFQEVSSYFSFASLRQGLHNIINKSPTYKSPLSLESYWLDLLPRLKIL